MRHDQRGFALPFTVLLITVITVMLASGFARVRADRIVAEGAETSAEALAVARSGLHEFIENQSSRPADGFIDTLYVTGGYAIVTAKILRNPADTMAAQLWVIRSTGYVIDANTGSTPRARRTVAQVVQWQTGAMNVQAALMTPNGIQFHNQGTITVDGNDNCTTSPQAPLPALFTAGATGPQPTLNLSGSATIVDSGSSAGKTVATATSIDWLDVLNGEIVPDYTSMPAPTFPLQFPITIITGDYSPGSYVYGSGLLIVTGDFEPQSWVFWYGVILVGGRMKLNSLFNYVYGALVTGLNEQIQGQNPQRTDLGWTGSSSSYTANIYYHSCFVSKSLEALTGFAPIDNAWVDNWATY